MCRFIETLRAEDGVLCHLQYHQDRMARTVRTCLPGTAVPDLASAAAGLPKLPGTAKIRFVYGAAGILEASATPYTPKAVTSLKLVTDDTLDYTFKSADRSALETLRRRCGICDDILIVRNGLLTDTSYTNIALFDGTRWVTPAAPLLCGTMRQYLTDRGLLVPEPLTPADLQRFRTVALINAMLPLGCLVLPTRAISDGAAH